MHTLVFCTLNFTKPAEMKLDSKYDLLDTPTPHPLSCWYTNRFTEVNICKMLNEVNICTINHYLLDAVVCKWLSYKLCKFVKKYFFCIKLLHAHPQYVCNISSKCWKDPVKALRGVDFTKNTLSNISY